MPLLIHRAASLFSGFSGQCDGFVLLFLCVRAFINQVTQRCGRERCVAVFLFGLFPVAFVLSPVCVQPAGKRRLCGGYPCAFTTNGRARLLPVSDEFCCHLVLLCVTVQRGEADSGQTLNFLRGIFCAGVTVCMSDAVGDDLCHYC